MWNALWQRSKNISPSSAEELAEELAEDLAEDHIPFGEDSWQIDSL